MLGMLLSTVWLVCELDTINCTKLLTLALWLRRVSGKRADVMKEGVKSTK